MWEWMRRGMTVVAGEGIEIRIRIVGTARVGEG